MSSNSQTFRIERRNARLLLQPSCDRLVNARYYVSRRCSSTIACSPPSNRISKATLKESLYRVFPSQFNEFHRLIITPRRHSDIRETTRRTALASVLFWGAGEFTLQLELFYNSRTVLDCQCKRGIRVSDTTNATDALHTTLVLASYCERAFTVSASF